MASARKRSSSKSLSASKRVTERKQESSTATARELPRHFAVCVRNDGYPASLELRKLYPVLEDAFGAQHGMIRVIDESGEDYLFPEAYFVKVDLPRAVEQVLQKIA